MSTQGSGGPQHGADRPGDPQSVQLPSGEWTTVVSQGPSPAVQATMDQMTNQLQTVIDAAERAAEAIRHDAENQARRHLAEAQQKADQMTAERVRLIAALTDDLVRHAGTVRDKSEEMVGSLEEAISAVTGKLEIPIGDLAAEPPPATEQATPLAAPESGGWAMHGGTESTIPQDALLEATRLAVGGANRATIAEMLRTEHGIDDPDPIVDKVLGPT